MINSSSFNRKDLMLCNIQFTIRHKSISNFQLNEIVFLKSNPEVEMKVVNFKNNRVIVEWNCHLGIATEEFPPECLLQYKFASQITINKNTV